MSKVHSWQKALSRPVPTENDPHSNGNGWPRARELGSDPVLNKVV